MVSFKEVLANQSAALKVKAMTLSGDPREDLSITLEEAAEVVNKLTKNRATGVDEICPLMLMALDIVRLSWLTSL